MNSPKLGMGDLPLYLNGWILNFLYLILNFLLGFSEFMYLYFQRGQAWVVDKNEVT